MLYKNNNSAIPKKSDNIISLKGKAGWINIIKIIKVILYVTTNEK